MRARHADNIAHLDGTGIAKAQSGRPATSVENPGAILEFRYVNVTGAAVR